MASAAVWQALLGIVVFTSIPLVLSENRRAVSWRLVAGALAAQFVLALLLLRVPFVQQLLLGLNGFVKAIEAAAIAGSSYMFGYLGGAPLPFEANGAGSSFIVAFQVLPVVLVMSALSAVLFYWGLLQKIIHWLGRGLQRLLGLDGLQTFSVASSLFFGIVEAPLLVKPYFRKMPRTTLFLVMTAGMSTVAGTVMVLYATQLQGILDNPAGHILVASLISLPAAVLLAHLWVPGTGSGDHRIPEIESEAQGAVDALVRGTEDGVRLMLNIIGMIIVLFACIHLANAILGALFGDQITIEYLVSLAMTPIVWLMGIGGADLGTAAELLSIKLVFNEFVAYQRMSEIGAGAMSAQANLIMAYAICGFANFASLGLIVGTISTMVPERTNEVAALAPRALLAGLLATCMTGAVVGLVT